MPTTFLRSPSWQLPPPLPSPKAALVGPALPRRLGSPQPPSQEHPRQALVWRRGRTQPSQGFQVRPQGPRGCCRLQQAGYFGGRPLNENRAGMLEAEHGVPAGWVRRWQLGREEKGRKEASEAWREGPGRSPGTAQQ